MDNIRPEPGADAPAQELFRTARAIARREHELAIMHRAARDRLQRLAASTASREEDLEQAHARLAEQQACLGATVEHLSSRLATLEEHIDALGSSVLCHLAQLGEGGMRNDLLTRIEHSLEMQIARAQDHLDAIRPESQLSS